MADRRRYPRVDANVLCRPAGVALFHHKRNTQDISLGGMRVFTDEEFRPGNKLELEVLLPDGSIVLCWAEVVWLSRLDGATPARCEAGLRFTDMATRDVERLASVLSR